MTPYLGACVRLQHMRFIVCEKRDRLTSGAHMMGQSYKGWDYSIMLRSKNKIE